MEDGGFTVDKRSSHKIPQQSVGRTAYVPPWPKELYRMIYRESQNQTGMEYQWLEDWWSSFLVLQVAGLLEVATQSEKSEWEDS